MKVYCIENIIDNKKYVGITQQTIEQRYKAHLYNTKNKKSTNRKYLHRAMSKHGVDNFIVYEIDNATTKEELYEKEIYWIDKLDTKTNGYNLTDGGEGCTGWSPTEEQKKQNSIRNKQYYIDNPEAKVQRSLESKQLWDALDDEEKNRRREQFNIARKCNPHIKGRTWTLSDEAKKNIGNAKRGVLISDESKKKMSISKTGEGNPSFGSIWITNQIDQKKIKKDDIIPDGWVKGRVYKKRNKKTT